MGIDANPPQTGYVVAHAGSQIRAWLTGPAGGPLVALSHGASMDHQMFDEQLGPLIGAGYRVLTWDIRGHGRSQPMGRLPIEIADMTDDLLAILDHLDVSGPICVGGQSLGGYIAQELVRREPERVAAVVIIGSTCTTMPIAWWEQWALKSSAWWFVPWPWEHLKRTIAKSTAQRPEVRTYAENAISMMSKTDFVQIWRAVTQSIRPKPGYRIEVPLLLTHGDQDRTGNVARTAPAWAARDPRCQYEVIPHASHNANQDNPEHFNSVLLDFLTEHYPAGGT
ncbi:alpha/beta fold hydrolase [Nesterenkonia ebinurensis]|uniref:alpha/beta fold hydrolase n=1 Tax=Nesterenkonia ebinurensis TaxID=2608252 RepID=UPI00123E053E|nr:alpha/beta hydrolase [Nesterenkonia ebinurensis]